MQGLLICLMAVAVLLLLSSFVFLQLPHCTTDKDYADYALRDSAESYIMAAFSHDEMVWSFSNPKTVFLDVCQRGSLYEEKPQIDRIHIRTHPLVEMKVSDLITLSRVFATHVTIDDAPQQSSSRIASVSEAIYSIVKNALPIPSSSTTVYYCPSKAREKELRKAYEKDSSFSVDNVTSGIHAIVLKSLFPNIKIKTETERSFSDEEKQLFPLMVKFLALINFQQ